MTQHEAERKIAAILALYERANDALVEKVHVQEMDATTIDSPRREMKMTVTIDASRRPGHDWMVD